MKIRNPRGNRIRLAIAGPRQKPANRMMRTGMIGIEMFPLEPRVPYKDKRTKMIRIGKIAHEDVTGRPFNFFRPLNRRQPEMMGIRRP